ncbi:hypothetical protein ABVT39_021898 [Epinephelus coioides]
MEEPTPQTQGSDGTSNTTPSTAKAQNSESLQDAEVLRQQIGRLEFDEVIEMNVKNTFQLQALEADLKTAEAKIQDLQKQCEESDTDGRELAMEIFDLNKRILDLQIERKCAVQALEKELSDSHDSVAALKQAQRTDDETHAAEVKQLIDSHIIEVIDYKQQLASLEAKLQEQRQVFVSALRAERSEQKKLKDELIEVKEQNWELKKTISRHRDFTDEVIDLREAVEAKDRRVRKLERDLAEYARERINIRTDWLTIRKDKATLEASLESLANTNADLQSKLKARQSEVTKSKRLLTKAGADLLKLTNERDRLLTQKNKAESQLAEQRNKVHALESTQKRFKADLEACKPAMSDFKSLKSKFVELCRRYLHNYRPCEVKMDMDLEDELRDKIASADTKLSFYRNLHKQDCRDVKYHQDLFCKSLRRSEAFLDQIKKLKSENISLRRDLDRTQRLLQKATKPVPQKVKSWFTKNVLGRVPVAQEVAEEPPTLFQDDWQPSDLPGDDILSSVQPCASEPSTSSGPDPMDGVIHVKPYVA